MPRVPTVRAADLDRVFRCLAKAGQAVARVEVRPGGEVVIVPMAAPPAGAVATPDTLTAPEPPGELSDLDIFRERKRQRGLRAT